MKPPIGRASSRSADARALRIAIAARDQVIQNPELRAAQERAWAQFVRKVWGGFPQPTETESAPRA
jgi:hypothetical protein